MRQNRLTYSILSGRMATALMLTTTLALRQSPAQASEPAIIQQAETSCIQPASQTGLLLKKVAYAYW